MYTKGSAGIIAACMRATIIMIASSRMAILSQMLPSASRIQVDPGRIAAGVVTGIGFLGAGAIIRIGDLVRGLTTGGLYLVCGGLGDHDRQGLYPLAIIATILALAVLLALTQVERRIQPVVYRSIVVLVALAQAEAIKTACRALLAERAIHLPDIANRLPVSEDRAEVTFKISVRHQPQASAVLRAVAALPGVTEARWF